jgi:hypothetical protein
MNNPGLEEILDELNRRSAAHPIGEFQLLRATMKAKRLPRSDSARRIFRSVHKSQAGDYAFHHGGGKELQFNVGVEGTQLRYGVAFSFEPSMSKPWQELSTSLRKKVALFNEFIAAHAFDFRDMRMWHDLKNVRIGDHETPAPIPWERTVRKDVFIFLGKRQDRQNLDYELILSTLDRLLPLYRFVEGAVLPKAKPFAFTPLPWVDKVGATIATQAQKEIDVSLRHNEMQKQLYGILAAAFGEQNVAHEHPCGEAARIDLVVKDQDQYCFYEIKTCQSPRECIRDAVGQLLEYAFWPGAPDVSRLIVAGPVPLDEEARAYLRCLKERFSLPLEYEHVSAKVLQ